MNEVIKSLKDHRSIRSYTDEPVAQEQLDQIIEAVQSAPSSINGQQVTVITVQDKERKRKSPSWQAASHGSIKLLFSCCSAQISTGPKLRLKICMISKWKSQMDWNLFLSAQ